MNRFYFVLIIAFSTPFVGQIKLSNKPATSYQKASSNLHAKWGALIESAFGITQDDFNASGLAKLTPDEFGNLLVAVSRIQTQAANDAKKSVNTYKRGRTDGNYDKVRLYFQTSEATPSEISSGVREKLRTLPDVEIVYEPNDGDIGITLLGLEDELESGHRSGYTVSISTYYSCNGSFGDQNWSFQMLENNYINTAPDLPGIINSVVAAIDTHDLEDVRKMHATIKKITTQKAATP